MDKLDSRGNWGCMYGQVKQSLYGSRFCVNILAANYKPQLNTVYILLG